MLCFELRQNLKPSVPKSEFEQKLKVKRIARNYNTIVNLLAKLSASEKDHKDFLFLQPIEIIQKSVYEIAFV